jgi:hypothetical protein
MNPIHSIQIKIHHELQTKREMRMVRLKALTHHNALLQNFHEFESERWMGVVDFDKRFVACVEPVEWDPLNELDVFDVVFRRLLLFIAIPRLLIFGCCCMADWWMESEIKGPI